MERFTLSSPELRNHGPGRARFGRWR